MKILESAIFWGVITLVASVFFGWLFYMLATKRKVLSYTVTSSPIITENLSSIKGLSVTFCGDEIPSITSSHLVIKNTGNTTIDGADIPLGGPIQVLSHGKFLTFGDPSSYIADYSNNASTPTLKTIDPYTLQLGFDYLDRNDKIELTLLHTSPATDLKGITVYITGNIKGGKIRNTADLTIFRVKYATIITLILSITTALLALYIIISSIIKSY